MAQKIRAHGRNWDLARALLLSYGTRVEAVTSDDAEWAARRWGPGQGLSLAGRLCLALGDRLDADVWTAGQAWGTGGHIRQIRCPGPAVSATRSASVVSRGEGAGNLHPRH